MAAKERVACPGCQGEGAVWPVIECPVCNGIGTVLATSEQVGPGERAELEEKIKGLEMERKELTVINEDLKARLEIEKAKADNLETQNDIMRARLEMIYLIFGRPGDMEG